MPTVTSSKLETKLTANTVEATSGYGADAAFAASVTVVSGEAHSNSMYCPACKSILKL